ncbi:MAG TPA: hypothetical protein VM163_08540 [bacterium]|nr:hypothetical protein [bacterium]
MEYWIQSMGENPRALGPIIVVIVAVVIVFILWAVSRLTSRQKELEKDRLALDSELYKLEKFATLKGKKQMGEGKSMPESFWPKEHHDEPRDQPAGPQPASNRNAEADKAPACEDEDDEFADIRRENLVRDWTKND